MPPTNPNSPSATDGRPDSGPSVVSGADEPYRLLFEHANDGILILREHRFTSCNGKALQMLECRPDQLIGHTPWDISPPTQYDGRDSEEAARAIIAETQVRGSAVFVWRHRKADGTPIDVEVSLSAFEAEGEFVAACHWRDITERRKLERDLRESEERYRGVYDTAPVAFVVWDRDCRVTDWNKRAEAVFGWRREEVVGRNFFEFLVPEDARPEVEDVVANLLQGEWPSHKINVNLTRDGRRILCEWNNSVQFDAQGEMTGTISLGIDITQRKQDEEVLEGLRRRLILAEERERSRIARELHDDLSQRLAAMALEVLGIRQDLDAGPETASKLLELQVGIEDMASTVHSLSRRLHPTIVEDLGLVPAIQAECVRRSVPDTLLVDFVPGEFCEPPTGSTALTLYRITQEALQNVTKHAQARNARVGLRRVGDEIRLDVEDDGVGFDPRRSHGGGGLGLGSMRERALLCGGTTTVHSEPGGGTRVEVRLPWRE